MRRRLTGGARLLGAGALMVLTAVALAGDLAAPHEIDEVVGAPYAPPGGGAVLGTDFLGRDVLSRTLAGGRELVLIAAAVAVGATAGGALLGLVAAVRRRFLGWVLERTVEILIVLPAVLVLLLVGAAVADPPPWLLAVVLAVLGVPWVARVVVAAAEPLLHAGYVEHAVASGETTWWIITREMAPNLRGTIGTIAGLRFVEALAVVAAAAFLHVGPSAPEANWALMVRENAPGLPLNPWATAVPSAAIALVAAGVTVLIDRRAILGLRP